MSYLKFIQKSLPEFQKNILLRINNRVSQSILQKVHIQPNPSKPLVKTRTVDYYDETNTVRGRPLAPHITIYAPEIQSVLSLSSRITSVVWTLQVAGFAAFVLVYPDSLDYYVDKINSWNIDPFIIFWGKFFTVSPACYHTIHGIRHIFWDLGLALNTNVSIITGWIVLILSIISSIYISLL